MRRTSAWFLLVYNNTLPANGKARFLAVVVDHYCTLALYPLGSYWFIIIHCMPANGKARLLVVVVDPYGTFAEHSLGSYWFIRIQCQPIVKQDLLNSDSCGSLLHMRRTSAWFLLVYNKSMPANYKARSLVVVMDHYSTSAEHPLDPNWFIINHSQPIVKQDY